MKFVLSQVQNYIFGNLLTLQQLSLCYATYSVVKMKHNAIFLFTGVNLSAMRLLTKKPAKVLEKPHVGAYSHH